MKKTAKTPGSKNSTAKAKPAAKKKSAPPAKLVSKAKPTSKAKGAPKPVPQSAPYEEGKWAAAFAPRTAGERRYWLVKSEPEVFSFDDLLRAKDQTTCWDGVRNFAARNFLRDGMRLGDRVFFYHSMADAQAIVGICEVMREGYPDDTALDRTHAHYDADSNSDAPTWFMVDLRAVEPLARPVPLPELKERPELKSMALIRIGRLSVTPVTPKEWQTICSMGR